MRREARNSSKARGSARDFENKVAPLFMHLLRVASHRTVPEVEVEEAGHMRGTTFEPTELFPKGPRALSPARLANRVFSIYLRVMKGSRSPLSVFPPISLAVLMFHQAAIRGANASRFRPVHQPRTGGIGQSHTRQQFPKG